MTLLLDNRQGRQIELIQILLDAKTRISVQELGEYLDVSSRSVANDLEFLASEFKDQLKIDGNQQGILLELDKGTGFASIKRQFFRSSVAHQIIHWVFFNPHSTVEDCAYDLHISNSSIRRTVLRINKFLEQYYALKLETNPLAITGDEEKIRHFYVQFFFECSEPTYWPFNFLSDEALLTTCIKDLCQALGIDISFTRLRYIKYAISIAWARLKQGHGVIITNSRDFYIELADKVCVKILWETFLLFILFAIRLRYSIEAR